MAKTNSRNNALILPVIVTLIVGFIAGYLIARMKYKTQLMETNNMVLKKDATMKLLESKMDRFIMLDGKMMVMKNGQLKLMYENATLPNGTEITLEGEVMKKDGPTIVLEEGESVDPEGNVLGASDQVDF